MENNYDLHRCGWAIFSKYYNAALMDKSDILERDGQLKGLPMIEAEAAKHACGPILSSYVMFERKVGEKIRSSPSEVSDLIRFDYQVLKRLVQPGVINDMIVHHFPKKFRKGKTAAKDPNAIEKTEKEEEEYPKEKKIASLISEIFKDYEINPYEKLSDAAKRWLSTITVSNMGETVSVAYGLYHLYTRMGALPTKEKRQLLAALESAFADEVYLATVPVGTAVDTETGRFGSAGVRSDLTLEIKPALQLQFDQLFAPIKRSSLSNYTRATIKFNSLFSITNLTSTARNRLIDEIDKISIHLRIKMDFNGLEEFEFKRASDLERKRLARTITISEEKKLYELFEKANSIDEFVPVPVIKYGAPKNRVKFKYDTQSFDQFNYSESGFEINCRDWRLQSCPSPA